MTNRQIRQAILAKLGITPQALYQRAARIKRQFGPMSTEDAIYWVAVDQGIDLSRFLDQSSFDRVRTLRVATRQATAPAEGGGKRPSKGRTPINVTIGRFTRSDPLLPRRVLDQAKVMAEDVYPITYVWENSVRELIQRVLAGAYAGQWWARAAPADVKKKVQGRRDKEDKQPWHGKRGAHEIYYTDIGDLRRLVASNWVHFQPFLPDQHWFTQRVTEIELSRNIIAHNNPLDPNDRKRLEVYLTDWHNQMQAVQHLIP